MMSIHPRKDASLSFNVDPDEMDVQFETNMKPASISRRVHGLLTEDELKDLLTDTKQLGILYEGYLNVDADGEYSFGVAADDSADISVDNVTVASRDSWGWDATPGETVFLRSGLHTFRARCIQGYGGLGVVAYWRTPWEPFVFVQIADKFFKATDIVSAPISTRLTVPCPPKSYESPFCSSKCKSASVQAVRMYENRFSCAICGDGFFERGREECDDGNLIIGDGCNEQCKVEIPERVNASTSCSNSSSDPGSMTVFWPHSKLSIHADEHGLAHRVIDYVLEIHRHRQESFLADGQYVNKASSKRTVERLRFPGKYCTQKGCAFMVHRLMGGEYINLKLSASNVAGEGLPWTWGTRWSTLPFGSLRPLYNDTIGVKSWQSQIQLSWVAPPSTGHGNAFDAEMPITAYTVQVSRCKNFSTSNAACESSSADISASSTYDGLIMTVYPRIDFSLSIEVPSNEIDSMDSMFDKNMLPLSMIRRVPGLLSQSKLVAMLPCTEHVGLLYEGYLNIDADGEYTFGIAANDSADIQVANETVASQASGAWNVTSGRTMFLRSGLHAFRARCIQSYRELGVLAYWKTPSKTSTFAQIPDNNFRSSREPAKFEYPFSFIVTDWPSVSVYEGLFYFFRITAFNALGPSNTTDTLSRLFGGVPCPRDVRCAVCGDAEWMPGREQCEDGNQENGDGCNSECQTEVPVQVNATVEYSEASSLPGAVTLTWQHSALSVFASETEDAPGIRARSQYKVLKYYLIIKRRRSESFSANGEYIKDKINTTVVVSLPFSGVHCHAVGCTYVIKKLVGGEYLDVSLTADNVAGNSTAWMWGTRWSTLPFGSVNLGYTFDVSMHSLTWVAPSSTGYGNRFEMPILVYQVSISRCMDFNETDPWCESSRRQISAFSFEKSAGAGFEYPLVYNVTYLHPTLHQGLFYYYNVVASNNETFGVGRSNTSDTMFQQYGKIPFPQAFIDYPTSFPVSVAIYNGKMHPWTGHPSNISSFIVMHLSGYPLVRGPEDLELVVSSYNIPVSAQTSMSVVDSSLAKGTTLNFWPSSLPESVRQKCGMPCTIDLIVTMRKERTKLSSFSLSYFTYPDAQTIAVVPTQGPINGGTVLMLTLMDFTGSKTRQGAQAPNLISVSTGKMELTVVFRMNGVTWKTAVQSDPAKGLGVFQNTDVIRNGAKAFDVYLVLPPSQVAEGLASISFEIDRVEFFIDSSQASLEFEYVGTQIMYITPSSGLLNPGSGGMDVNVVVLNLPSALLDLKVKVGGAECNVKTISQSASELGVASSIACAASELSLEMIGTINVVVTASGVNKVLAKPFQYIAPPQPVIEDESVVLDGRNVLWVPSGRKQRLAKLLIANLSPKYAVVFDKIRVVFEGKGICSINGTALLVRCPREATDVSFMQVGFNTEVRYMTPDLMPPAATSVSVSIYHQGQLLMTLPHSDIEFRDISLPRSIVWAPSEGPAKGGTVFMMGIQSLDAHFTAGNPLNCTFASTPATVVAVLSVAEFEAKGTKHSQAMNLPALASWFLGLSQYFSDQYDKVVKDTANAVLDTAFNPTASMKVAAVAFVSVPKLAVGDAQVMCNAGEAVVYGNFKVVSAPRGAAEVSRAATDDGDLRSGMGGGVKIAITLVNFAIVYKGSEISVMFGDEPLAVSRLAYSTAEETKCYIIVPPSLPRELAVQISPSSVPANKASFSFTYFDDRVPVIEALGPYLVYETGGKMTMTVSDLPILDSLLQYRIIVRQGLSVQTAYATTRVEDSIAFSVPAGTAGLASAEIWADIDDKTSKNSNPINFEYSAIPTAPATVFRVSPDTSSNFGGREITVYIQNMKVVADAAGIRAEITLDNVTAPATNIQARSTMAQTTVSFFTPAFESGGTAAIRIWEVGREAQTAQGQLTYIDQNIAVLVYSLPDSGKANKAADVEVGISRFGIIPPLSEIFVGGTGLKAIVLSATRTASSDTTVVTVRLERNDVTAFGSVDVTVAACSDPDLCSKKSVSFRFLFRDPNAVWVSDVTPMAAYIDGRTPLAIGIENMPADLIAADFIVVFSPKTFTSIDGDNNGWLSSTELSGFSSSYDYGTIDTNQDGKILVAEWNAHVRANVNSVVYKSVLASGSFELALTVSVPNADGAGAVKPEIHVAKLNKIIKFPVDFTYLAAPSPVFGTIVPVKAKTNLATPVSVTLLNFPGVSSTADIEMKFRWSSGKLVPASVSKFAPVDPSKHPAAIQDYNVLIMSPVGDEIKEGTVQLICFHSQYRRRVARTQPVFTFLDATSPEIVGMSSAVGMGTDSAKVQMSKQTQVFLFAKNAKNKIMEILVGTGSKVSTRGSIAYAMQGPTSVDLDVSAYDGDRSAQSIFSMPGSAKAGPVLGMIKFEKGCGGDACSSAVCCEDSSCIESCKTSDGDSCKLACFTLIYFDDLQPRLLDSGEALSGPEIGSSSLKLTIAMLPPVDSGKDITVKFDDTYIGAAYVLSSTSESTSLSIVTPPIPLGELASKKMQVHLQVGDRRDRALTFEYTALAVSPSLISVKPETCFSDKPTPITLSIEYFPYPGDAVVMFDDIQIGAENITVLPISNLQKSVITVTSPVTQPGRFKVLVFPKSCPKCGKSVTFAFILRDSNQPELVKPIPTQGQRFPKPGLMDLVRVAKLPLVYSDITVRFELPDAGKHVHTASKVSTESVRDLVILSYQRPWINTTGTLSIVITITTPTEVKMMTFPFFIFDETAVRLVSSFPSTISTRLSVYGRGLDLRSSMDLVVSNFPPNIASKEVKLVLVGGLEADVLAIEDISRCEGQFDDCNRTRLKILAPAYDVPGIWAAELSVLGNPIIAIDLSYFAPCNYQSFCEAEGKIVDKYLLDTRVPISPKCDAGYCLALTSLADPEIVSIFPTQGPSTGGTILSVIVKNLPAFAASDLSVEVGSGATKQMLAPESVIQDPGSSTRRCQGVVTLKMPPVSGGQFGQLSQTVVQLVVKLGLNSLSAGLSFEYTPVIQGPCVVSSFFPQSGFPGVDTEIKILLTNFPRLTNLADSTQVQMRLANFDIASNRIESSSNTGTIVSFKTGAHLTISGPTVIQVFLACKLCPDLGRSKAGSFSFTVLPMPSPEVQSFFPNRGRAKVELRGSVTVLYMDPATADSGIWSVSLSGLVTQTLEAPAITTQSVGGCTQRHCAKFKVQYVVPKDAIPSNGGRVTVAISVGGDQVTFELPVDADDTPSIESVEPSSMSLEDSSRKQILFYLRNVLPTFCSTVTSCTVAFGLSFGSVTRTSYANQILSITVRPPSIPVGGSGPGKITYSGISIPFEYTFVAPPASPEPIDGACSGGQSLTLTVVGWGSVVSSAGSLTIYFGAVQGQVVQVVSSVASASFSQTVIEVSTPILPSMGIYNGVVSNGVKSSQFSFECFEAPTAKAIPASSTLNGRVFGSIDGKSIQLVLINFPAVETTADVVVAFGTIECDGIVCSVLRVTNSPGKVSLMVTTPKVPKAANVQVKATYTGKAAPPQGGDPSKVYIRSKKIARTEFSHYRPSPVVISARFCSECSPGRTCISNGRCKDGISPRVNALGSSGAGVLTLVVDNFPLIPGDRATGEIMAPAKAEITFGEYVGSVSRILYSDELSSSFEVALSSAVAVGTANLELKVYEDAEIPVFFSALTAVTFFDENVRMACRDNCEGPSTGSQDAEKLHFFVMNLAVSSAAELMVSFGNTLVLDLEMLSSNTTTSTTVFSASIPSCSLCTFTSGLATVQLSVAFASDGVQMASMPFKYYSAPAFAAVQFSATGTTIECLFDQATDRANMNPENTNCSDVLSDTTVAVLGDGATCTWSADDSLTVFFGKSPVVVPNDVFALRKGKLKAAHKKSPFSTATLTVARPTVIKQPEISVKGVGTIDPCSSLEVRVSALSPRPVRYLWSCINDADFNSFLGTVSSSTLFLAPGTSQMVAFPKEYILEISVVDFLGVASLKKRFSVLKKATASPQIEFNPPNIETLRNAEVLIKGETIFSACLVEETELSFSWRQLSGPLLASSLLSTTVPQLRIPPDSFTPGSVVQLSLKASMSDISQSSESIVLINVGYQELTASIRGAVIVSTFAPVFLSARSSRDHDLDASAPQGLAYSWECSFMDDGYENACRDPEGYALELPKNSLSHSNLTIDPGVLVPRDGGYTFRVTVQKGTRSSLTASMFVNIVKENIPTISIALPPRANVAADGTMIVNREDRLVFAATSSASNTTYDWTMPGIETSHPLVCPLGEHAPIFIFNGVLSRLQAGTRYKVHLQGTTAQGSVGTSSLDLLINSAPLGGSFSVCLLDVSKAEPVCIKTGQAVTDDFRLEASSWTDPDLPLHYEYGYMLNESGAAAATIGKALPMQLTSPANTTNVTNSTAAGSVALEGQIWFEPVRDNIRDMGFPAGQIILLCRVIDALGAATNVLTDDIQVSSAMVAGPGGRRLLAANDFFAQAKSKLSASLKTFRADKVNQMANSVAVHADSGGLGPVDSSSMKGSLMASLKEGTSKAVKTTGFACEAFGAGKTVTGNAGQLSGGAVSSSAGMLKSMVSDGLGKGGMNMACAGNAASMMGSSLKAQAMFAKQNKGANAAAAQPEPMLSPEEAASFLSSLEGGMNEVMRQANWDAISGEPARKSASEASQHSISRTTLAEVSGTKIMQALPSLTGIASEASFALPRSFSSDVFGSESPEIDLHVQVHGGAPSVGVHVVRSALVGMTVSRAHAAGEIAVNNLTEPFNLTIPIDTSTMSLSSRMLLAQQAACVHWNQTQYSTHGCNVSEVSLTHVTCTCSHLTMFALSQDTSIAACGDGVMQKGEDCDDFNIYSSDGCSSRCTIEAAYICTGEPSKW
jgi:cysteine-rich repeat protein